jgi:hypothetical protein
MSVKRLREEEIKKILEQNQFKRCGGFEARYKNGHFSARDNLRGTRIDIWGLGIDDIYAKRKESKYFEQYKKLINDFKPEKIRTEYNEELKF